jgi:hypothetical protein
MKTIYTEDEIRSMISKVTGVFPNMIKFVVRRDDGARLNRSDFEIEAECEMPAPPPRTGDKLEDALNKCRQWEMSDAELAELEK